jgi:hypothetical protein
MTALAIAGWLVVKLALYGGWCAVGIRYVRRASPSLRTSLLLAGSRIAVGFAAGATFLAILTSLAPQQNRLGTSLPLLVGGFVVLRWLEWWVVSVWVATPGWRPRDNPFAGGLRQQAWALGGVVVSFVSDAGTLLGVGAAGLIPC